MLGIRVRPTVNDSDSSYEGRKVIITDSVTGKKYEVVIQDGEFGIEELV